LAVDPASLEAIKSSIMEGVAAGFVLVGKA